MVISRLVTGSERVFVVFFFACGLLKDCITFVRFVTVSFITLSAVLCWNSSVFNTFSFHQNLLKSQSRRMGAGRMFRSIVFDFSSIELDRFSSFTSFMQRSWYGASKRLEILYVKIFLHVLLQQLLFFLFCLISEKMKLLVLTFFFFFFCSKIHQDE